MAQEETGPLSQAVAVSKGDRGSRPAAVRGEEQEDSQAAVSDQLPLVEPGRVGSVMGSGVPGFVT